jgi:hypothetical protein
MRFYAAKNTSKVAATGEFFSDDTANLRIDETIN